MATNPPFSLDQGSAKHALTFFADSIEVVAQSAPKKWGVTPFRDAVRLNVGFCEALTVYQEYCRVLALESRLPRRRRGITFSLSAGYAKSPGSVIAEVETESTTQLVATLSALRSAHEAALGISSRYGFNAGARDGHSDGAVQLIGQYLGRTLPVPRFVRREQGVDRWEGAVVRAAATRYERNHAARDECIAAYGSACAACGILLEQLYGPEAQGLIHVHHLRPLAARSQRYRVDPIRDLRPVCPNCHAVIHSKQPPLTIEKLRRLLRTPS